MFIAWFSISYTYKFTKVKPPIQNLSQKIILNTEYTEIIVLINVSINVQLMLQEKALRLNINYDTNQNVNYDIIFFSNTDCID